MCSVLPWKRVTKDGAWLLSLEWQGLVKRFQHGRFNWSLVEFGRELLSEVCECVMMLGV